MSAGVAPEGMRSLSGPGVKALRGSYEEFMDRGKTWTLEATQTLVSPLPVH